MSLIRIYIATTDGPVEVVSLSREDPELRCVVCENGRAKALPISRDYDAFVKEPTGVIERSYHHAGFRVDVSRPITNGLSWQLGLFLAHALYDEQRLAQKGERVETALWLSGEIDRNLDVQPVDHIEEKLKASKPLFEQLKMDDIRLHCFIPSGGFIPDDDLLAELGIDGDLLRLEMVRDLRRFVRYFSLNDPYAPLPDPDEDDDIDDDTDDPDAPIDLYKDLPQNRMIMKDSRVLKAFVLGLMILALFGGIYMQFKDNILALRENALALGIHELRAHPDKGCQSPEVLRLSQEGAQFPSSPTRTLCALEITLNNRGSATHMWAFAQRLSDGHLLMADRESLLEETPRKGILGWRLTLPDNLGRSIDYRIVGLASDHPLKDPVERLIRNQIEQPEKDWEAHEKHLKDQEITVISAIHSLIVEN